MPLTRWYLKKQRDYRYKNVKVTVYPGVFHPGLFYSTKFILEFLLDQPLKDKKLLELGCGSGLISVMAAKAGAHVTASDLNAKAIDNASLNARLNKVEITTVHSDLFDNLHSVFDVIVINPPYYRKEAKNDEELAWNCGENLEYFTKLFSQLSAHIHAFSQVIMVLTKGCEFEKIISIARKSGLRVELVRTKDVLFDETDFLYQIYA